MSDKTKVVFTSALWDEGSYIISARPENVPEWKAVPIGGALTKSEINSVERWLNHGGWQHLRILAVNLHNISKDEVTP